MTTNYKIDENSFATVVLCTDLAVKNKKEIKALTVTEWAILVRELIAKELEPKHLISDEIGTIMDQLNLDDSLKNKIYLLLSRTALVSLELSEYFNRGIFVLTKRNPKYPSKFREKLKDKAPPVLFYAGNINILSNKMVAIVGSRDISEKNSEITALLTEKIVDDGYTIVSGGARGADSIAELTSLRMGGQVVSVLSEGLDLKVRKKETREAIARNELLIMSATSPSSRFLTSNAMQRNKYIYALSEHSLVIQSTLKKGGTWNGAIEALKLKLSNLFALNDSDKNNANNVLIEKYSALSISLNDVLSNGFENYVSSKLLGSVSLPIVVKKSKKKSEQMGLFPEPEISKKKKSE